MKTLISLLALTLFTQASVAADEQSCSETPRGVEVQFVRNAAGNLTARLFVNNDNGRIELESYNVTVSVDTTATVPTAKYEGINSDRSTSKLSVTLTDEKSDGTYKGELSATVLGQEIRSVVEPSSKPQLVCKPVAQ